ncbi:MAG: hypothetical protein ACERKZ_08040 [Lachnotalea sp.]
MKNKLIEMLEKYGKLLVLLCIVISALGIVFSYVFPKGVFYEIEVNEVDCSSEFDISLSEDSVVQYKCNTGEKPMAGIQVWISKEGAESNDGKVIYEVYNGDSTVLLGTGEQLLKDIDDPQFVYCSFQSMKECNGDLTIKFYYTGSETTAPVLRANQNEVEAASTSVDGTLISGNLESSYIYINETHPLVFDLKVMLAIFVTVFFTLESKRNRK